MKKYKIKSLTIFLWALVFFQNQKIYAQDSTGYYGVFNALKIYADSAGQIYIANTANVVFSTTAQLNINPYQGVSAGNVKINDKQIAFKADTNKINNNLVAKYYIDETDSINFNTEKWQITGNEHIPNFLFINPENFPDFNISRTFPDTVALSDTIIVSFENIVDADSIAIYISDNAQNNPANIMIITTAEVNNFYLTPSMLLPLSASSNAQIAFEAIKYATVNVGNKRFSFRNHKKVIRTKAVIVN